LIPVARSTKGSFDAMRIVKLAIAGFGLYLVFFFGSIFWSAWRDGQKEAGLRRRTDFAEIAAACEKLTRQLGTNESLSNFGQKKMPDGLQMLPVGNVYVYPDSVRIFYGGAHHHWGLDYLNHNYTNLGAPRLDFTSDGRASVQVWP